jgi:hypothetical protein
MTDKKTMAKDSLTHDLPRILEFAGHGTGLGKSLLATTSGLIYRQLGYEPVMVRIETRQIQHRDPHIAIPTETFAKSATFVGGISAVVAPLFEQIKKLDPAGRGAIIIDWAGGHAHHRNEVFAATRFAERLAARGLSATSIVVTTNTAADIANATALLSASQQILSGVTLRVALNRRRGNFTFEPGSTQARALDELRVTDVPSFNVRAVGGDCWKACDEAGMSILEVLAADVDALANRLSLDDFIAAAIQAEVATWYTATEAELLRSLRGESK